MIMHYIFLCQKQLSNTVKVMSPMRKCLMMGIINFDVEEVYKKLPADYTV